jgi:hypothetical protein
VKTILLDSYYGRPFVETGNHAQAELELTIAAKG